MAVLMRIFKGILLSSAMSTVLVLIIFIIKLMVKNKFSGNWHYCIWFLLLLRLIIPYGPKSSFSIYNTFNGAIEYNTTYEKAMILEENTEKDVGVFAEENTVKEEKEFYFMIVWIAGVLALALYTIFTNIKLYIGIKREEYEKIEGVQLVLQHCKSAMNIKKNIPIIICNNISTPALLGLIKPKLLLPKNILDNTEENQLKYIIFHELSHYKRKDIFIRWINVTLKILHWFNPVIWYGLNKMSDDCEIACDEKVLSYIEEEEHKKYGYTIINLLNLYSNPKWMIGTAGMATGKTLAKRRIEMISKYKKTPFTWIVLSIVIFTVIGAIGLTNGNLNKGITVTLSDKEIGKGEELDVLHIVHSTDIINTLNKLKDGGAKKVYLNDEKVSEIDKVSHEGMFIVVNNKKITHPFTIKALGEPEKLKSYLEKNEDMINAFRYRGIGFKVEKL